MSHEDTGERRERRTRTMAATAGRMRKSEERKAAELESRGWRCYSPEQAERVVSALIALGMTNAQ
jgi:hypothetical protein